jgi:hypothetical protein
MGRRKGVVIHPLPAEVSIIGRPWKVLREKPKDLDDSILGYTSLTDRVIFVRPELARNVAEQVFSHELVHSVLLDSGLHNLLSDKMQEAVCDAPVPLVSQRVLGKNAGGV